NIRQSLSGHGSRNPGGPVYEEFIRVESVRLDNKGILRAGDVCSRIDQPTPPGDTVSIFPLVNLRSAELQLLRPWIRIKEEPATSTRSAVGKDFRPLVEALFKFNSRTRLSLSTVIMGAAPLSGVPAILLLDQLPGGGSSSYCKYLSATLPLNRRDHLLTRARCTSIRIDNRLPCDGPDIPGGNVYFGNGRSFCPLTSRIDILDAQWKVCVRHDHRLLVVGPEDGDRS